jgi:hypothetical protein
LGISWIERVARSLGELRADRLAAALKSSIEAFEWLDYLNL